MEVIKFKTEKDPLSGNHISRCICFNCTNLTLIAWTEVDKDN